MTKDEITFLKIQRDTFEYAYNDQKQAVQDLLNDIVIIEKEKEQAEKKIESIVSLLHTMIDELNTNGDTYNQEVHELIKEALKL